jgi:hypothetical protein
MTGFCDNENLIRRHRSELVQAVLKVFKYYRDADPEEFRSNPLQKLKEGLRYPYIFSIKKEPHPLRKVALRKWRVIIPSGIVNQCVERLIICGFQQSLDETYGRSMQATRIGFDDEGVQVVGKMYTEKCKQFGAPGKGSDASGWDVSVCEVGHFTFGDVLVSTCYGKYNDVLNYQCLVRTMCIENSDPLFAHNGNVFRQNVAGMVHSGCYVTTPGNGVQRGYLACKCDGDWSLTRGDDCIEWNTCELKELARRYTEEVGLKVRDVEQFTERRFILCSHEFKLGDDDVWTAALTSWKKSVINLLAKKRPTFDDLNIVMYEMRHNEPIEKYVASVLCMHRISPLIARR